MPRLAQDFVRQAREALLEERPLSLDAGSTLRIIKDPLERLDLLRLLRTNNPELRDLVRTFFRGLAAQLAQSAAEMNLNVELIDRAGLTVAGSLTAGGVGLLMTLGVALGPLGMFCGGLIGLAICGTGRHKVARRSLQRRHEAELIREFLGELTG